MRRTMIVGLALLIAASTAYSQQAGPQAKPESSVDIAVKAAAKRKARTKAKAQARSQAYAAIQRQAQEAQAQAQVQAQMAEVNRQLRGRPKVIPHSPCALIHSPAGMHLGAGSRSDVRADRLPVSVPLVSSSS